jgi:hypothetical protein
MARFCDTYAEISPSGLGIKIWAKGRLPGRGTAFYIGDGRVEVYDRARYFTVTGDHWPNQMFNIEEHQPDLDWLLTHLLGCKKIVTAEGRLPEGSQRDALVSGRMLSRGRQHSEAERQTLEISRSAVEASTPEEDTEQIVGNACTEAPAGTTRHDSKGPTEVAIAELAVAGLPGPEPQTPDVLPILAIHRDQDGLVTFHRKSGPSEKFENLEAIRAKDLPKRFAGLREKLNCDSYFSINSFWHPDRKSESLPAGDVRDSANLRHLCAVYSDLDFYKLGLDFGTAFATVLRYQDEGVIPPASLILRSGRGMWVLWSLHDPKNPGQPQRAFSEKVSLYLQVNGPSASGYRALV